MMNKIGRTPKRKKASRKGPIKPSQKGRGH